MRNSKQHSTLQQKQLEKSNKNKKNLTQTQNYDQLPIIKQLSKINYQSLSCLQSVLKDQSTIDTYMKVIIQNHHEFNNKIVLHLTTDCNCLYSIFAAKSGAKKVYCILNGHNENEQKNMYMMEAIIKQNGFHEQIQVVLYRDFKLQIKADILIGEPMGCNLIYDGMIERIIQVRDLFLNQNTGLILPNRLNYKCAFIWDEYQKDEKMDFWDQVYGVSMKEMKKWVSQEPIVRVVDPTLIVSEVSQLFQFDLFKVSYEEVDQIRRKVHIRSLGDGEIKANGLAIWFEAIFTKADGTLEVIDASPWSQQTRWSHATLYTKGQWILEGKTPKKIQFLAKKNHLSGNATIKLKIDNSEQIYVAW